MNWKLGLFLIIIGIILLIFYLPEGLILITLGFVTFFCKMPSSLKSKREWGKDKKKIKIGLIVMAIGSIITYSSYRFYTILNNAILRWFVLITGIIIIFIGLVIYPSKYMRPG